MAEERQRNDSGQYSGTLSEEQVLEAVGDMDHVATTSEVADVLGKSIDTARRWLNNLHEDGKVERKKVGARGVVWWVELEDDGSNDDEDEPTVMTLKRLSQDLDDSIYLGNTEFVDGKVLPGMNKPPLLDKPALVDDFIEEETVHDEGKIKCVFCGQFGWADENIYTCVNCGNDISEHFDQSVEEQWKSHGWEDVNDDSVCYKGACPQCVSDGRKRVREAKEDGYVTCELDSHTRHRPDAQTFQDCWERGNIPMAEGQYEEIKDSCT